MLLASGSSGTKRPIASGISGARISLGPVLHDRLLSNRGLFASGFPRGSELSGTNEIRGSGHSVSLERPYGLGILELNDYSDSAMFESTPRRPVLSGEKAFLALDFSEKASWALDGRDLNGSSVAEMSG